jgi:fumarylpyruvate hydrolase
MTRRDLQGEAKKLARPWDIGKGFDESAPVSPIVPAERCKVGHDTRIMLEVNGSLRQDSTIGKLIWSIPEIIAHLSSGWRLEPGDLIYTGTPEGVAAVKVGDVLGAEVTGVGKFRIQMIPPRLL